MWSISRPKLAHLNNSRERPVRAPGLHGYASKELYGAGSLENVFSLIWTVEN